MVKDKFNQIKQTDNTHELKIHSDHLKNHEQRLQAIETSIPSIKADLKNEFSNSLNLAVKEATKDLSKELKTKVQDQIMTKVDEEIEKVIEKFDTLRNEVFVNLEQKIATYKGIATEIMKNKKDRTTYDLSDNIYVSMAVIVSGTVSQCQHFQDDCEMIYGLRKIYCQTTQFPNKFEVVLQKSERGSI